MRRGAALVVTLLVLANSAAFARSVQKSTPYVQLAHVPDDAARRVNPLENDPGAPIAGKKLFERHCVDCHGVQGENGRKGPSLTAPEVQDAKDGSLFWVITNGNVRAGMPVWSRLPEPQRWQITAYLKSLGPASIAPPAPGPAPER
jgi:mono/diheme cytochrome c family protein